MPFPESERVRFGNNPLVEVVCQLRFPTVLRIDSEAPAAFQEVVRQRFPEYKTNRPQLLAGIRLPPEVAHMVMGGSSGVAHEFLTADGRARVSLTRDFVALSVTDYTDWAAFKDALALPIRAVAAVYSPPYFSRLGLRYRDQIDRTRFGLEDVPWSELLRPEVAGELADAGIGPNVQRIVRELGLKIPDGSGAIRLVHGLDGEGGAATYMIDADFYSDKKTPPEEALNVLDAFNRRAGHLFRWCIKPRLHDAMDPRTP